MTDNPTRQELEMLFFLGKRLWGGWGRDLLQRRICDWIDMDDIDQYFLVAICKNFQFYRCQLYQEHYGATNEIWIVNCVHCLIRLVVYSLSVLFLAIWEGISRTKWSDVLLGAWNLGVQLCADYRTLFLWTWEILRQRDCIRNWTRCDLCRGVFFHSDIENCGRGHYR